MGDEFDAHPDPVDDHELLEVADGEQVVLAGPERRVHVGALVERLAEHSGDPVGGEVDGEARVVVRGAELADAVDGWQRSDP